VTFIGRPRWPPSGGSVAAGGRAWSRQLAGSPAGLCPLAARVATGPVVALALRAAQRRENAALMPDALSVEDAARMLGLGREMLDLDIQAGAPTNAAGASNLLHYTAWLSIVLRKRHDRLNDGGQVG